MEEPPKHIILDIVNNLRENQICRLIYFAEIKSHHKVSCFFDDYSKNSFFSQVSGLLLIYPTLILHLVEADEETIYATCLDLMISADSGVDSCRCLPIHVSRTGRIFPRWYMRKITSPAVDFEESELSDDLMKLKKIYFEAADELYKFYWGLKQNTDTPRQLVEKLDALSSGDAPVPRECIIKLLLKNPRGFKLSTLTDDYWNKVEERENIIWPIPEIHQPSVSPRE